MKGGSENHVTDQLYIWRNGRISPYFCERPVQTTSIWSKSLTRFFPWICDVREGNLGRGDIVVADIEELEEVDASELHA